MIMLSKSFSLSFTKHGFQQMVNKTIFTSLFWFLKENGNDNFYPGTDGKSHIGAAATTNKDCSDNLNPQNGCLIDNYA